MVFERKLIRFGCSTGETIKMLSNLNVTNKIKMIGIDG